MHHKNLPKTTLLQREFAAFRRRVVLLRHMKSARFTRQLILVIAFALTLAWVIGLSHVIIPFALEAGTRDDGAEQESDPDGRSGRETDYQQDAAPGELPIRALAEAYPERIDEIEIREGQWAARIDGTWYYYARGRMLPRDLVESYAEFSGVRLYRYRTGPAELPEIDEERAEQLRRRMHEREIDPPVRHNGFLDALYQVRSAREAEQKMIPIRFLGFSTRVHPMVVEPLDRVEAEIRELMHHDREVRRFVEALGAAGGYSWREIAGTASRSYHSYGIAIDLIPRSYQGGFGYWRWAMQAGIEDWWELPFERRWEVPQPVIDAFERQEFIWGGKWLFFDPLHFEYRPELFILGGYRDR